MPRATTMPNERTTVPERSAVPVPAWSRRHRISFRVAVGLLLLALAAFPPVLAGPVLAWLDADLLDSMFLDEGLAMHRVHIEGGTLLFWLTIVALIAQFRSPERKPAPVWAAAAAWVFFLPIELTHLVDPWTITVTVLAVAVVALHPRRWPTDGVTWRSGPLGVAVLGAVPAAVYAVEQVRLQLTLPEANPHVEDSHYALMAALVVGLVVSAVVGATDVPGHRISARTAGIITIALAAFFIGHTGHESSVPVGWGVALIAWAVAYLWVEAVTLESGGSS